MYAERASTLAGAQKLADASTEAQTKAPDTPKVCGTCTHRRRGVCLWYWKKFSVEWWREACCHWEERPNQES